MTAPTDPNRNAANGPHVCEKCGSAEWTWRDHRGCDVCFEPPVSSAAKRSVSATEGWTPLEFYAFIIRSVGLPAKFYFDGSVWVGDGPFTKPVPPSILELLEAQGV